MTHSTTEWWDPALGHTSHTRSPVVQAAARKSQLVTIPFGWCNVQQPGGSNLHPGKHGLSYSYARRAAGQSLFKLPGASAGLSKVDGHFEDE